MKILGKLILILVVLMAGYLVGSYFPIRGFFSSEANIKGNAELKVTVLRPDQSPATNLEVDIATEAGQVLEGGHVKTDSTGVATFHIKPNNYFIFFNAVNFPKDLEYHGDLQVTVEEGKTATQTITLFPAK